MAKSKKKNEDVTFEKVTFFVVSILLAIGLTSLFTMADTPIEYDNSVKKWSSKSYIECRDGRQIIYAGFSASKIVFDGVTRVYSFRDPNTGHKIYTGAECKVDMARRKDYDDHYAD